MALKVQVELAPRLPVQPNMYTALRVWEKKKYMLGMFDGWDVAASDSYTFIDPLITLAAIDKARRHAESYGMSEERLKKLLAENYGMSEDRLTKLLARAKEDHADITPPFMYQFPRVFAGFPLASEPEPVMTQTLPINPNFEKFWSLLMGNKAAELADTILDQKIWVKVITSLHAISRQQFEEGFVLKKITMPKEDFEAMAKVLSRVPGDWEAANDNGKLGEWFDDYAGCPIPVEANVLSLKELNGNRVYATMIFEPRDGQFSGLANTRIRFITD